MQLILSDIDQNALPRQFIKDDVVYFRAREDCAGCSGCFSCWFEHPGSCPKRDGVSDFVKVLSECDELLILSKNTYGSYSPGIKNVLDRSISYVRPSFCLRNGEMRHRRRYKRRLTLKTVFYGQVSPEEKIGIEKMTAANALNLYAAYKGPGFISGVGEEGK